MKLITEEISNAEYIVEEANGKKNYSIRGVFMQSDVKNRNGRIYPKEILQKEVARYNREFIQKNRALLKNAKRDYVYVDDVVAAIATCLILNLGLRLWLGFS